MSGGMYGADVAQLRALAAQFSQAADQLDRGRLQVGNGIRISAWVGPFATSFRLRWDSEHSLRVAGVAQRLRDGAARLRSNADQQDSASAVNGGSAPGFPSPPPGSWSGGGGGGGGWGDDQWAWWDGVRGVWKTYRAVVAPFTIAASAAGIGFLVSSVRGTMQLSSLNMALQFSSTYQALDSAKQFMNFGATAGKVFGWVGVGFDVVSLGQEIAEGDVGEAVWAGVKTGLSIAAVASPPPANLVFGGARAVIGLTEFTVQNWDTISAVADATWDVATDVVGAGVDFVGDVVDAGADLVGDVTNSFVDGVSKVADALWPW